MTDATELFWVRQVHAEAIEAIGFDLDFTLAPYDPVLLTDVVVDAVEQAFGMRIPHRLDAIGIRRGDIIDTRAGRLIRTDPFGVALAAWNLDEELETAAIAREYGRLGTLAPPTGRFRPVDSYYAFGDAVVFLHLVAGRPDAEDHTEVWERSRAAVDAVHAAGVAYQAITSDPMRFLPPGWDVGPVIEGIRASGRRPFLVTNSPVEHANRVLTAVGVEPEAFDWAVFEADKPAFFRGDAPLEPIGTEASPHAVHSYRGGSLRAMEDAHTLRGVEILYVGDHMYGDVIRASRLRGWRTVLIVPEMAQGPASSPFRTEEGVLTYFGWQAVRFAWSYAASALALGDLDALGAPPRFSITMPHETGATATAVQPIA